MDRSLLDKSTDIKIVKIDYEEGMVDIVLKLQVKIRGRRRGSRLPLVMCVGIVLKFFITYVKENYKDLGNDIDTRKRSQEVTTLVSFRSRLFSIFPLRSFMSCFR